MAETIFINKIVAYSIYAYMLMPINEKQKGMEYSNMSIAKPRNISNISSIFHSQTFTIKIGLRYLLTNKSINPHNESETIHEGINRIHIRTNCEENTKPTTFYIYRYVGPYCG